MVNALYLHGFASSANSSKARFFADRLAPYGVHLITPDFNQPDFENLTVTRMIEQVRATIERLVAPASVALIGSSLGGFVALHAAAEQGRWGLPARIDRLVLLAPAVDFGGNRMRHLGQSDIEQWRRTDRLDVFHHGFGRQMSVRYALYDDASRYDSFSLQLDLPTLVFQGTRDASVDPATVSRWASGRSTVCLRLLDDDHQLLASLDRMWGETFSFLLPDHSSECSRAH